MKRIAQLVLLGLLMTGVVAAIGVQRSAPATHGLPEVGIGESGFNNGTLYISGKQFDCQADPTGSGPDARRCAGQLGGDSLELRFRADPSTPDRLFSFLGSCTATYRGESHPCESGIRRGTSRSIAFIPDALGLTDTARDSLRQSYPIENDVTNRFFWPVVIYGVALALAAAAAFLLTVRALPRPSRIAWSLSVAVFAFVFTYVAGWWSLWFLWD
ncbi:MAG: hypothetical protein H6638_11075 [Ardenticatenales bacterium]|nr:hypothetical protein [Ardenticatenales bacterium]